eukprot:364831-Chlamydomonas_euryale.AAC.2
MAAGGSAADATERTATEGKEVTAKYVHMQMAHGEGCFGTRGGLFRHIGRAVSAHEEGCFGTYSG